MTLEEAFLSIAVAVAAGTLIGAEREQAHASSQKEDFGGVRTFPLLAMLGVSGALLAPSTGYWIIAALLGAVVVALGISQAQSKSDDVGVSSEVAALITFALGVIAGVPALLPDKQRFLLVAAIAAVTMALLALKRPLHGFIAKVSRDDVYATVKFVLLALVVIPILPDRTYGPLDVLNPRKIGLMVVLVAGVSFAGYVAARTAGKSRGLLVTGLIGGLVSSTALTLAMSGRAKQQAELAEGCAISIVAACATMFARILVIVAIVDGSLAAKVALPLGGMALAGYAVVITNYRRLLAQGPSDGVEFKNPFELKQALVFGLLYTVVLFVAKGASASFGQSGVYASSVLAGIADVDAITLSLAELHRTGALVGAVAPAIALAAVTNTLVKAAMSVVVGGFAFGRRVVLSLLLVLLAGALGVAAQVLLLD